MSVIIIVLNTVLIHWSKQWFDRFILLFVHLFSIVCIRIWRTFSFAILLRTWYVHRCDTTVDFCGVRCTFSCILAKRTWQDICCIHKFTWYISHFEIIVLQTRQLILGGHFARDLEKIATIDLWFVSAITVCPYMNGWNRSQQYTILSVSFLIYV